VPVAERPERQAAVERALAAGWALIGSGALVAAVASKCGEACASAGTWITDGIWFAAGG